MEAELHPAVGYAEDHCMGMQTRGCYLGIIQPDKESEQSRLSAAAGPHNSAALPRLHPQAHALEHISARLIPATNDLSSEKLAFFEPKFKPVFWQKHCA